MASNEQAKLEAEKLLSATWQQGRDRKGHKASEETAQKAAQASRLIDEIGKIHSSAATVQQQEEAAPAPAHAPVPTGGGEGAELLAERIIKLEEEQQMARLQIQRLLEAKKKLEQASRRAREQTDKLQQEHHIKLQKQLNTLIQDKEQEYERIHEQISLLREHSEQESAVLKAQRDAARTMAQEQQEQADSKLGSAGLFEKYKKALLITGGSLLGLLLLAVFLLLFIDKIPFLHRLIAPLPPTPPVAEPTPPKEGPGVPVTQQGEAPDKPKEDEKQTETELPTQPITPVRGYRDRLRNGGLGPIMIEVPGGDYFLGGLSSRPYQDELPMTKVKMRNFSISKYEITQEEYLAFARAMKVRKPRQPNRWEDDKLPVVDISWEEAKAYTEWLSNQTGRQYRLPSEREWEYAASAGLKDLYPWGNAPGQGNANCADCKSQWDNRQPAPVGSFPPNALGLHDVMGNVKEWIVECRHVDYRETPVEAHVWEGGKNNDCTRRMVRGGSYRTYNRNLRISARAHLNPRARTDDLGFRVVRVH